MHVPGSGIVPSHPQMFVSCRTELGQEMLCACELPVTAVNLIGSGVSYDVQEAALDLLANLAENGSLCSIVTSVGM